MSSTDLESLSPSEKRAALALLLAEKKRQRENPPRVRLESPPIPGRSARPAGDVPLSFTQERLWFLQQLEPNATVYNNPVALRLSGPLETETLRRSFGEIARRHEILRTTFHRRSGKLVARIAPEIALPFHAVDLAGVTATIRSAELAGLIAAEMRRVFDLERGPLFALTVVRMRPDEHVVIVNMHHIVTDAWSLGVVVREAITLYDAFSAGLASPLPELEIQYADFARWQRGWVRGEVLEGQLRFWRERLNGLQVLELPTDHPRSGSRSHRGARELVPFAAGFAAALRDYGRREGATLFVVVLAAFTIVLGRHADTDDVAIGSPITNRANAQTEGLIGAFVNTLVLRTSLAGNPSCREIVRRVRATVVEALAHGDLPFEKLVEALQTERSLTRPALFGVTFGFPQVPLRGAHLGGRQIELVETAIDTAKFDIALSLTDWLDRLGLSVEYRTDLFERDTILSLLRQLQTVLGQIVADPDRPLANVTLLDVEERRQLVAAWNAAEPVGTADAAPEDCVHELFRAQVRRTPNSRAVSDGARGLTYAELDRASDAVAAALCHAGIRVEDRVAIAVERSPEMVAAVLGTLKAGATYVPLELGVPARRQDFILTDGGVRCIIADAALRGSSLLANRTVFFADELAGLAPAAPPPPAVGPRHAAYVIYTSGSTGRPKGVIVEHASLARYLRWVNDDFLGRRPEVFPVVASLAFDMCLKTLLAPLLRGAEVWLVGAATAAIPSELLAALDRRDGPVGLNCVPSFWRAVLGALDAGQAPHVPALSCLVLGGEPPGDDLLPRTWAHFPGIEIFNVYGPTEATANAAYVQLRPGEPVTIGRPIAHTRLYVLDAGGEPVPRGARGELYIGGENLARGYLTPAEATAERFVPDPFRRGSTRMYRTGDRARFRTDGRFELFGRTDEQVKIRGYRIELGEVRAALRRDPSVVDALVVPSGEGPERRLAAYVVSPPGGAFDPAALSAALRAELPEYMLPRSFVRLEALPRLPNGKPDVRRLPAPPDAPRLAATRYVAPGTELERAIAHEWRAVLGIDTVGLHDNFFELGGHSLRLLEVQAALQTRLERDIAVVTLFEHPTVQALARALGPAGSAAPLVEAQRAAALTGGRRALSSLRSRAKGGSSC